MRVRERRTVVCKYCQDSFETFRKSKTYCSAKCIKSFWKNNNLEKDYTSKKKWLEINSDKRAKSSSEFMKRNRAYYTAYAAQRRALKKQAQPPWINKEEILKIYQIAQEQGLEVDHIVPLKHDKVCGLHVPWNLQLLTRKENAMKSNKFDEDIICVYTSEE